jgi:RNA polymerase sigma factor (TIGR02999 family)
MTSDAGEVTQLLGEIEEGNQDAASKLMDLVYEELHRRASHFMRRERPDHTLQTTALVHETYLRLVGQRRVSWRGRAHFFAVAAKLMRRILVDHARRHHRVRRGGARRKLALEEADLLCEPQAEELLALDEMLTRLSQVDPRQGRIVELRFFGGLTDAEAAKVLGISEKTVRRDWDVARAWLHGELRKPHDSGTLGPHQRDF